MHTCSRIACLVALITVSACKDDTDHSVGSPAASQVQTGSSTHENVEPPYADLVGYQVVITSAGENRGAVGTVVAARRDVVIVQNDTVKNEYRNAKFLVPHNQITLIICTTCGREFLSADERDFLSKRRKAITAGKAAERAKFEQAREEFLKRSQKSEEEESEAQKPEME